MLFLIHFFFFAFVRKGRGREKKKKKKKNFRHPLKNYRPWRPVTRWYYSSQSCKKMLLLLTWNIARKIHSSPPQFQFNETLLLLLVLGTKPLFFIVNVLLEIKGQRSKWPPTFMFVSWRLVKKNVEQKKKKQLLGKPQAGQATLLSL